MGQWRGIMIADDLKDIEMKVKIDYRNRDEKKGDRGEWGGTIIRSSDSMVVWARKMHSGVGGPKISKTTIGDIFIKNIQTQASGWTIITFQGAGPRRGDLAQTM